MNKKIYREAAGYWLVGLIGAAATAAFVGTGVWSSTRTSTQTMEGDWSRTVIDQDLAWLSYVLPFFYIFAAVWTVGVVAYYLIEK